MVAVIVVVMARGVVVTGVLVVVASVVVTRVVVTCVLTVAALARPAGRARRLVRSRHTENLRESALAPTLWRVGRRLRRDGAARHPA